MWTSSKAFASLGRRVRSQSHTGVIALAATALVASRGLLDSDDDNGDNEDDNISHDHEAKNGPKLLSPRHSLSSWTTTNHHHVRCDPPRFSRLRRHSTIQRMQETAAKESLESKYDVPWCDPLGQGTFGTVYVGKSKLTGEEVAVKKILKQYTDSQLFQREMYALLHLREAGGHPNIAQLRENFDEGDYYYLVFDLVRGGEMFDQLCSRGAYSEADAARLVREVASALAFMHGIGIVHGDLKPENLMLSSESTADSSLKVVDFGSAQVTDDRSPFQTIAGSGAANTPAYAPPEAFDERVTRIEPSFDMWALGVIVFIMLTGIHPFDLYGNATDADIQKAIVSGKRPPLRKSPITAHLSPDAISVIESLIQSKPESRLSADELLENSWVRGETARTSKIADSDKRLSAFRAFRTKISEKVFKDMLSWTIKASGKDVDKRTSLLERAFNDLDPAQLRNITKDGFGDEQLSLAEFSNLLAENMKNRYFPKGHVIYKEGDIGNNMFFLNSGSVEVYSDDGFCKTLKTPGDFFGEGALLHPQRIRSASIRCLTPVHAIEISREYFEKYVAADEGVNLDLRETNNCRKRQRANSILNLQRNTEDRDYVRGDYLFRVGDTGKDLYIMESGKVDITVQNHTVFSIGPGSMCGEHSPLFGKPRNVSAQCMSDTCRVRVLKEGDLNKLLDSQPSLRESLRDICLRREFQKALCVSSRKPFPKSEGDLRRAFHSIDRNSSGTIELENVRQMLHDMDPNYSEHDVRDILDSLDIDQNGEVTWEEFKRLFDMDEKEE